MQQRKELQAAQKQQLEERLDTLRRLSIRKAKAADELEKGVYSPATLSQFFYL